MSSYDALCYYALCALVGMCLAIAEWITKSSKATKVKKSEKKEGK